VLGERTEVAFGEQEPPRRGTWRKTWPAESWKGLRVRLRWATLDAEVPPHNGKAEAMAESLAESRPE
jgi:hypothetical protein